LNSVDWVTTQLAYGETKRVYSLVVCVDIADLFASQAMLNGASAVAMLVGPDAPLEILPERAHWMLNTWDFYKPVGWKDNYPLMRDGAYSIDCYMKCLDGCQNGLVNRLQATPEAESQKNLVTGNDYFVHHCTSTYLCKRAFKRICENAFPKGTLSMTQQLKYFNDKANPACLLTKRIGSSYTASCYTNLYSLCSYIKEGLVGKSIVLYSYGSGSASGMYRIRCHALPTLSRVNPDIFAYLDKRKKHTPETYVEMIEEFSETYGRFDFKPKVSEAQIPGVYYLDRCDEWGVRYYKLKEA